MSTVVLRSQEKLQSGYPTLNVNNYNSSSISKNSGNETAPRPVTVSLEENNPISGAKDTGGSAVAPQVLLSQLGLSSTDYTSDITSNTTLYHSSN